MLDRFTGQVKRKQRESFARFLRHGDERVRHYAESILQAQRASASAWEAGLADIAGSDEEPSHEILTLSEAEALEEGLEVVAEEESWDDDSWRDELPHEPALLDDEASPATRAVAASDAPALE